MTKSSQTPTREFKTFRFQVKAIDDAQGTIEAYGSVFDNEDQGGDVVRFGAFKRTIQNSKSRVQAGKAKFLAVMLWQHNAEQPIGGWTDLQEDSHGLLCKGQIILSTQLGKEAYELIKAGVIQEFSIGYEVMPNGSNYDGKTGVRNLTELRLWEVSPVTFAMNQEALLTSIKANDMQMKSVCGKTNYPLTGKDVEWDGDKADKQIVEWITKDDSSYDFGKLQDICFYYDSSVVSNKDATEAAKLSAHKLPYCYISNEKPEICIQRVYDIAGVLQGAHGGLKGVSDADIAAIKKKVSTLYNRIAKELNDDTIEAPWDKDDGKMNTKPKQRKTLLDHFNEEQAEDLLEDWMDVYVRSLTGAVFDAFTIGDQPAQDISEALDAFKELVLSKFVAQAVECDLSQYLADNDLSFNPAECTIHNGSDDGYYSYMSRSNPMQRKEGRAISNSNQTILDGHTKCLHGLARKARTAMQTHVSDMHDTIDDMAGNGKSFNPRSLKAGRAISASNAQSLHDMADKAMTIMQEHTKALRTTANDLANQMQGAESPMFGDGEGEADEDQQEGKNNPLAKSSLLGDNEIENALSLIKGLRTSRSK
jgi:HK97 family phage prohead protease